MHEELAPESRAAQLLSALEAERRLYLQLFSSLPTPALVLKTSPSLNAWRILERIRFWLSLACRPIPAPPQ